MDKQFYVDLLDRVSDGVYFVDRDRRITYWNAGAERLTGYRADEMLGRSCSEGFLRHVDGVGRQLCANGCPLAAVMADGESREADVYLHHRDGQRVPVAVQGHALRAPDGAVVGSAEVFAARVSRTAADRLGDDSPDPVTGLPSRRWGERHLEALLRGVAEGAATLGVLFVDADRFKEVNDTFGHRTGDDVLRMLGQSLANGLRAGDVAMRWGGEEFLILLPGIDQPGLEATAERVRMLVANSWIQRGRAQVRVTVSVGATMAAVADTADDLVDRADQLMYASKRGGRNRATTDTGELISVAERPIVGTAVPWEPVEPDRARSGV